MYEPLKTGSPEYQRAHRAVRKAHGDPIAYRCSCGLLADHWAWIHGLDPWDTDNYWPMCHSCHVEYDGIAPAGERHARSKLKEVQVLEIREMWANNTPQKDIADIYGVSYKTISAIVTRRTWTHI